MATLSVLTFDPEGRSIKFDTWLNDLQLYPLSDSRDSVSLFDHTSGASLAPPDTAVSATRSHWLTRDAAACLAIRSHLPLAERAHFGRHKIAKSLYDAVVARYSSPATAALGRLILPYLFLELSNFATVEDLITHLRTSDTRYRAALKAEFLDKNPPPMYITPYFIVTHLPDSLRTVLVVALLAHPSLRGVPPPPLPPPTPLLLLLTSLVLKRLGLLLLLVGSAAAARAREERVVEVAVTGVVVEAVEAVEVAGVAVGVVAGVGASVAAVVAAVGVVVAVVATVRVVVAAVVAVGVELFRGEVLAVARGSNSNALHTFTLDSGASRYFFRDSATLTPLHAPVLVRLADPSGDPVLARSTNVLPCPAVPSGSLSGLHLPSFSTNLVSTAALQDVMVTTTTTGGQRVVICTCTRTGRYLTTFTRRPGSSLYTLTTEPAQVAASSQVSASGQVAAPCSCRLLLHQTLLWHHRLGHPSLPCLRGMHSRLLVSGLPRSLPPLPPSLPHLAFLASRGGSAPLLTPPRFPRQLLSCRLSTWTFRLHLRERFRADLPVLRLHSKRGGEFSSDLLRDFCRGEGILQSFTLPDSPQQNGIADRRIGLVMEVARTSMIHAAAPHFMWPFADVTFDKSVPLYHLFPYRTTPLPPPPLFLAPGPPPTLVLLGVVLLGVLRLGGAEPAGAEPGGAEPACAEPGGAEPEGAELGGAETEGAEPGGAESEGAESGGVEPRGTTSAGGPAGASPR
ncbi:unnamed protein product [Closterium sp. NIES-54]